MIATIIGIPSKKVNTAVCVFLLTFLYASFFLPGGSALPTLLIAVYGLYTRRVKLVISKKAWQNFPFAIWMAVFVAFCFLSMRWATVPSAAYLYSQHLLKGLFAVIVITLVVSDRDDGVDLIMKAAMWGGYIVIFYVIARYGISYIRLMIQNEERFTNDVLNGNKLAMCAAYSCVIHIYFGFKKKWNLTHLLLIPAVVIVAACGSRKGIISLIFGVVGIYTFDLWDKTHSVKTILKIIGRFLLIGLVIILVLQLPLFSIVRERVFNIFEFYISGSEDVDKSIKSRDAFIHVGIDIFLKHPLIGVGIHNAQFYNYRQVYLHNNFVEMLADGGIVGFAIFYSIYIYIFVQILRRKAHSPTLPLSITLFLVMLMMHYGQVAYRNSEQYLLLLSVFMDIKSHSVKKAPPHIRPHRRDRSFSASLR